MSKYKIGKIYHWGSPKGGGQMYQIVGKNRHFLFLRYGYDTTEPEQVFTITKKEATKHRFSVTPNQGELK